jgi:hypothetical protein
MSIQDLSVVKDFALTYLATITSAVATTNSVADKEYFNGKGTTPDGYDPTSSRSRLGARYRTLMQDCAPARKYIRHALVR